MKYPKAINWIDNIKKVDCRNDYMMQRAITSSWLEEGRKPSYRMYEEFVNTIGKVPDASKYPSLPKIAKTTLDTAWNRFVKPFKPEHGEFYYPPPPIKVGKKRDATTGKYVTGEYVIIRSIPSITHAPEIPVHLLADISKTFRKNKDDLSIEFGPTSIIYIANVPERTFHSSTYRFFNLFQKYSGDEILNLKQKHDKKASVYTHALPYLMIVKYEYNDDSSESGLAEHMDTAHYGTVIWILEEKHCFSVFGYKGPSNSPEDWIFCSTKDGYTTNSELKMVDNLYHRIKVLPTKIGEEKKNWSRIVLVATM